jgi:hypothetical protein
MAKSFTPGDRVQWNTPQGTTRGKVKKKLTTPRKIKGHAVGATKQNPQYLVASEKSGKPAAHKPAQLQKIGSRSRAKPRKRRRSRA